MLLTDSSILKHRRRLPLTVLDSASAPSPLQPAAGRSCSQGHSSVQGERHRGGETEAPKRSPCPALFWDLGGLSPLTLTSLETGRNCSQPGSHQGRRTVLDSHLFPHRTSPPSKAQRAHRFPFTRLPSRRRSSGRRTPQRREVKSVTNSSVARTCAITVFHCTCGSAP